MWLKAKGFKDLIKGWWQGIVVRGRPSYRLAAKLKGLKQNLKIWNKEVFGRLERNKAEALQQVERWDLVEEERSLTKEELGHKKEAKENYAKWVSMEEVHWRQLSRELWLREEDRNTGFFHRMADARRRVNALDKIKINGVRITEEQEISQSEAEALELPFSEVEIYAALMGMNGDKAPGPDGFTVAFWQRCWEIVKKDVLDMFKEFHEQNSFNKSLNHTFLVLANRLKKVIRKVISSYQNAFIKGRQILDGSLIANEVMQKMGFGPKWIGWMWSCISTAKFSVLVNGVLAGFFSSSKGLRQGDPLSPLLICHGNGREVEGVHEMAVEIRCRVGQLPAVYLGLPLGASNKASSAWDGVEEKVRRRKERVGVKEAVCLNKALLGKWIWRFARAKEELWKKVLEAKYGQEDFGWRTRKANGVFGVGV
ncbi:hypothetical protein CK203_011088 [Vitis vinifera]|uniref:Uncharacterized protein n=1 Tax=Vitis vinifera TaxID=29760 RepID=A0A438JIX2_VITVI|nr:hypothetical protein CK203_011088 [Vitis vinifera]